MMKERTVYLFFGLTTISSSSSAILSLSFQSHSPLQELLHIIQWSSLDLCNLLSISVSKPPESSCNSQLLFVGLRVDCAWICWLLILEISSRVMNVSKSPKWSVHSHSNDPVSVVNVLNSIYVVQLIKETSNLKTLLCEVDKTTMQVRIDVNDARWSPESCYHRIELPRWWSVDRAKYEMLKVELLSSSNVLLKDTLILDCDVILNQEDMLATLFQKLKKS